MEQLFEYESVKLKGAFEDALKTGFIDSTQSSEERFRPKIVANSETSATNLLSVVKKQLSNCDSFDFSVAFIADGGLQVLVDTFAYLQEKGVRGRLLTSTYLNFTSPKALKKLLEYENIELRVYQGNMHAKGYIFDHKGMSTIIVGSSNMTQTALTCNREWNVLFHSYNNGEILQLAKAEFEELWEDGQTAVVDDSWIAQYGEYKKNSPKAAPSQGAFKLDEAIGAPNPPHGKEIKPNKMQSLALEALDVLHERNESRALLVSATGTGKTYLSALEVKRQKPAKILFVAHRSRILEASMASYERVLGREYSYGLLQGGGSSKGETCLFAMVNTLVNRLEDFSPAEFDYIIIDEAHRTGAQSYQRLMSYFQPKFYLGMTATPSRTDGYDVYGLFNHVIAYRITLQDALAEEMLAPFHYFGIADLGIDDEIVDDPSMFARLTCEERVRHITQKIEEYSVDKEGRRGLVFCNRNDEAAKLSAAFNSLGYKTDVLSGADSDEKRNAAIARLESGELEYIFSVDILNEGVDIPSLNQIIMLRRTESPIVFIQQLGRGLRKHDSKEYALVLDFIGNYQRNYLVPIALSDDRTFNKDTLRAFVKGGSSVIPGCSTVTFDRVSERRIFESLDAGKFGAAALIKDEYAHLKNILGRIPSLMDFDENEAIDPLIIMRKFGSYAHFLMKYEKDYEHNLSDKQLDFLKFISAYIANGKRREEFLLVEEIANAIQDMTLSFASLESKHGAGGKGVSLVAALRVLGGGFSGRKDVALVEERNGEWHVTDAFLRALKSDEFRRQVRDVVEFAKHRYAQKYVSTYKDTDFVLYAKYTYEEVCRLLNWEKSINAQNIGGYKYDKKTNTFPVFINYEKAPDIEDTIRYEDRFISENELVALSKQPRHLTSPEIVRLQGWPQNGMKTYLFMRKNKNDEDGGKEFYFLGEMHPTGEFHPVVISEKKKPAVEIHYRLETPVRADLYDYLTSTFEE